MFCLFVEQMHFELTLKFKCFTSRKWFIHISLNIISQFVCLPYILLILFPFNPHYYLLGILYNVASCSIYILSVLLCIGVSLL